MLYLVIIKKHEHEYHNDDRSKAGN
jgi:hypothetical protein